MRLPCLSRLNLENAAQKFQEMRALVDGAKERNGRKLQQMSVGVLMEGVGGHLF